MSIVEDLKNLVDHAALLVYLAVLAEWLPVVVMMLSAIWYVIRIGSWTYETLWGKK